MRQHPKATVEIPPGSRAVIAQPGGGGYGDPAERDPAAIAADREAGWLPPSEPASD